MAVHALGLGREEKRSRQVGHIKKIPALGAIADDREWFAGEFLGQENAEDSAVGARSSASACRRH